MTRLSFWVFGFMGLVLPIVGLAQQAEPQAAAPASESMPLIRVLIVDGQNNHDWRATTPVLKQILERSGRFTVTVATAPPKDTSGFRPHFSDYQVVLSNYNGAAWPQETQRDFEAFVSNGGGFVVVHAANNSFPDWPAYNEMIGLGGWGGRNEKSGPYLRFRDQQVVLDRTPGRGGSHGRQHEFVVEHTNVAHPITKGLPNRWKHSKDELYDRLRGPAANLQLLATAYSDPETGGTGEQEPILFTVQFGDGRIFHTVLGHSTESMRCVGFATTLQRGTEWAATGTVTLPPPATFPTPEQNLLSDDKQP